MHERQRPRTARTSIRSARRIRTCRFIRRCVPAISSSSPARSPRTRDGNMIAGTIEEETPAPSRSIGRILAQEGATLADVVRVTTYLEDTRDFGRYNKVFAEHFKDAVLARTTVEARAVINTKIEMDAIAYKPLRRPASRAPDEQDRGDTRDQALGRQTSGNVQKVLFMLEELARSLHARGLRPPVRQHPDAPNTMRSTQRQGADPGRRRHRDLGVQHHPALSRGMHAPAPDTAQRPPREARSSAGWTGCSARSIRRYLAVFKDAKNAPEARAPNSRNR